MTAMWDVLVGDVKIGRLITPRADERTTHCAFAPTQAFGRYATAFAPGDISETDDETLDAVIDEIAVEGVFLLADDGTQIVDPNLRIDGDVAWFQSSSRT